MKKMSNEDSYTSRVTKCFDLLSGLLTKYPRSIDEVEEDLVRNLEFYQDLASYVPQEKDTYIKEIHNSRSEVIALELVINDKDKETFYQKLLTLDNYFPLALDLED